MTLFVGGQGQAEAEEGGGPFPDEDAPPVGALLAFLLHLTDRPMETKAAA